ncbi:hypothetical protein, partial [Psychroserpens luteolus]|uniref:hypothetical protein n=1 Tax=Psychroserpens luteolus TaxID=2855840 RepID=UPI001E2B4C12
KGQRISKQSFNGSGTPTTKSYYIRDTSGNPLAIYNNSTLVEHPIYGASRVGIHYRQDGSERYQMTDHLGNVRALVKQDLGDDPVIYEEDFNETTSTSPWTSSTYSTLSIADGRLKCVITRNWHNARVDVNLEAGKEYQFSYRLDRSQMQGGFSTLLYEPGQSSPTVSSGMISESGDYSFTFTANTTGSHRLLLRGWISTYPNNTEYLQANTFYIDNVL